jgi:hypothetical protein
MAIYSAAIVLDSIASNFTGGAIFLAGTVQYDATTQTLLLADIYSQMFCALIG